VAAPAGVRADPAPTSARTRRRGRGTLGHRRLRALLDERVQFRVAPEVVCLDLYKEFDVDRLTALAEPTAVHHEGGRQ
jgi:hypothetical protein